MKRSRGFLFAILMLLAVLALVSCSETPASAYDLAVQNGYTGDVVEWLSDLQGDDLDIKDIYSAACEEGYEGDFLSFLKEYLSFTDEEIENAGEGESTIDHALLSGVSIRCSFQYRVQVGFGFGYTTMKEATQSGSGVIYRLDRESGDAYIITNYHVVYYHSSVTEDKISDNISVYLYGKESYLTNNDIYRIPAEYIGGSMQYDIAVLKVSGSDIIKNSDARAVEVMNSNLISVGTPALAIGNAKGIGLSVTRGVVSIDSETTTMTASDNVTRISQRVIRVDTAINEGNSGGGLFNEKGKLIGIVNAKIISDNVDAIGYAIPSNVAVYVADNIIELCDGAENKQVKRCMLGITLDAVGYSAYFDTATDTTRIRETVAITSVASSGFATGSLQVGDIITKMTIAGTDYTVDRTFIPIDLMLTIRVGDTVTFSIIRNAEPIEVSFTMGEDSIAIIE